MLRPDTVKILCVIVPTLAALLTMAPQKPAWSQAGAPSPAADQRLKELESTIKKGRVETQELQKKAQMLADESAKLRGDLVKAARAAQENEEVLSELEHQLEALTADESLKTEALGRRGEQMVGVLTALQRLAWRPSEALMAQPTSPADTVRSAILLRNVVPRIEESAIDLKGELTTLSELRADIVTQRKRIASTTAKLASEHGRIKAIFERKAELQARTEAEQREAERRVDKLAAEANDLRDLLAQLEQERKRREAAEAARLAAEAAALEAQREAQRQAALKAAREANKPPPPPPPPPKVEPKAVAALPFSQAQGKMPFPARGRIVAKYGQTNEVGHIHKGITIRTRPGAQVVSPYDGHVAFAGQFRGYGLLLIIEHGEGYHTLLAGMERIDGVAGQRVVAGEPVGIMVQTGDKPALYVELRRNGQPINPLPWLTARKDKVNG